LAERYICSSRGKTSNVFKVIHVISIKEQYNHSTFLISFYLSTDMCPPLPIGCLGAICCDLVSQDDPFFNSVKLILFQKSIFGDTVSKYRTIQ
jgi:hypothetical protein